MATRSERTGITADRVLKELAEIAFKQADTAGVRTSDRIRALELMGKHLGMFRQRVELTGAGNGPVEIVTRDMTAEQASKIYKASMRNDRIR